MTYKEKLEAYRTGKLSEKEAEQIENEIDKFTALLDFVDEKVSPVAVAEEADSTEFTQSLNKFIDKKTRNTVLRVLGMIALFTFLFVCGIYGTTVSGGSVQYAVCGLYSAVYISTMFILLYRSFVKKEILSAIMIILWTVGLTAATFIVSLIIRDAAPFIMPAYFGFSGLFQIFSDLTGIYFFNEIVPLVLIAATLILAVVSLIFSKKKKEFKPIPNKVLISVVGVFCAICVAITVAGTVSQINNGAFPDEKISSQKNAEAIMAEKEKLYVNQYLGKDLDYALSVLGDGYEQYAISIGEEKGEESVEYQSKKGYRTFGFNLKNGVISNVNHYNSYRFYGNAGTKEEVESIKNGKFAGMTQEEVLNYLFDAGLIPCTISSDEKWGYIRIHVEYPELDSFDMFDLYFKNGVCVEAISEDDT